MRTLRLFPLLRRMACLLAFLPVSCGIRLPDPTPKKHGVVSAPVAQTTLETSERDPDVMIWLIADRLHTGMVFPYDWLLECGYVPPQDFGNPRYVTLSWGNRTAYVQRGLTNPWQVVRALFTPSPSVMELIPADWHVVEVCPHQRIWRKLVPREQGVPLAAYLNDISRAGPDGRPIVIGTSSWGDGVLLESRHTYYFPKICNIWTAQAIIALGGKMNSWRSVSADGIIRQAELPANGYEKIWPGSGEKRGRYR